MKTKIFKALSVVLALMVVLSTCICVASAAEAKITFDDKAKRTSYSTSQQIWVENGITVTNNKGSSTSNVGDYFKPARFYKSSEVIIEYPGMTKIVIDCTGLESKYVTGWANSFDAATATVAKDGNVYTFTLTAPADSFTFA